MFQVDAGMFTLKIFVLGHVCESSVICTGGKKCLSNEVRRVKRKSQNTFYCFHMNMLFPGACLLDMEKGVWVLGWCGRGVVEPDAALPVVTFCLVLA